MCATVSVEAISFKMKGLKIILKEFSLVNSRLSHTTHNVFECAAHVIIIIVAALEFD